MDDQSKSILVLIIACVLFFIFGFYVGIFANSKIEQKEIIELSIELKKLEIKKLIKENNND